MYIQRTQSTWPGGEKGATTHVRPSPAVHLPLPACSRAVGSPPCLSLFIALSPTLRAIPVYLFWRRQSPLDYWVDDFMVRRRRALFLTVVENTQGLEPRGTCVVLINFFSISFFCFTVLFSQAMKWLNCCIKIFLNSFSEFGKSSRREYFKEREFDKIVEHVKGKNIL